MSGSICGNIFPRETLLTLSRSCWLEISGQGTSSTSPISKHHQDLERRPVLQLALRNQFAVCSFSVTYTWIRTYPNPVSFLQWSQLFIAMGYLNVFNINILFCALRSPKIIHLRSAVVQARWMLLSSKLLAKHGQTHCARVHHVHVLVRCMRCAACAALHAVHVLFLLAWSAWYFSMAAACSCYGCFMDVLRRMSLQSFSCSACCGQPCCAASQAAWRHSASFGVACSECRVWPRLSHVMLCWPVYPVLDMHRDGHLQNCGWCRSALVVSQVALE